MGIFGKITRRATLSGSITQMAVGSLCRSYRSKLTKAPRVLTAALLTILYALTTLLQYFAIYVQTLWGADLVRHSVVSFYERKSDS